MISIKNFVTVLPMILWLIFLLWIGSSEYFRIAIQAQPEIIASYHFGAESMVTNGGEKYRSALAYSRSNLISAILSVSGIIIILLNLTKRQKNQLLKAYFVGFLASVLQVFF